MRTAFCTIIIMATFALTGCEKVNVQFGQPDETPVMHDNLGNVRENMQLEPLAPISANPLTVEPEAAPQKIAKPKVIAPKLNPSFNNIAPAPTTATSTPVETSPATPSHSSVVHNNWQPNEALLIRSQELLLGLQKELGKKPTAHEMQHRLQTHMGLSATQAQSILHTLGM